MKKTPLEEWIRKKIGHNSRSLTRNAIREYQLQKLKDTILHARTNSVFYKHLLKYTKTNDLADIMDIQPGTLHFQSLAPSGSSPGPPRPF